MRSLEIRELNKIKKQFLLGMHIRQKLHLFFLRQTHQSFQLFLFLDIIKTERCHVNGVVTFEERKYSKKTFCSKAICYNDHYSVNYSFQPKQARTFLSNARQLEVEFLHSRSVVLPTFSADRLYRRKDI